MVNLIITQDRKVTGDTGKIIAYVGQDYSETICIVHPIFPGCRYYIEYKYNNTIYKNELDENGHVSLKVENSGYLKCQFIAIDIESGNNVFSSYPWNLIIKESLQTETSHYPCNSINHLYHHNHKHNFCDHDINFNAYEAFCKLKDSIDNESDIRFTELQLIRDDIMDIKKYLHLDDTTASTLDADLQTNVGQYYANSNSEHFPEPNTAYKLIVSTYGNKNILQHAYEDNSNNVYYRSATSSNNNAYIWNDWIKLDVAVD